MTLFDPESASALAAPVGSLVRVRLTVAYDGSGFHGFAPNPGVRTVGGVLAKTIERVLGHAVELTCAGRTDAGVHARGQVVTFDADVARLDLASLQRALNKLCGPELVVPSAEVAPPDFDARRSALARRYRYQILNVSVPDPFLSSTAWQVDMPLDLAVMRLACDPLIGEHDFSSFCRRPKVGDDEGGGERSLTRRVLDARWEDVGDGLLRFWIEANAFCHQMVRSIVGTLVDVGTAKKTAGDVSAILRARNRSRAGSVAPPHGLSLWEVIYPAP